MSRWYLQPRSMRHAHYFLILLTGFLLTSCAKGPPEDVKLRGVVVAAENANPDLDGAPSSVMVIVFQLATVDVFNNGDFFSLYDPEAAALGGDLLGREQMTIQPGETREFEADFDPETVAIGVVVAYRDIENATWKSLAEIPEVGIIEKMNVFKKQQLKIAVDELEVAATIGKK